MSKVLIFFGVLLSLSEAFVYSVRPIHKDIAADLLVKTLVKTQVSNPGISNPGIHVEFSNAHSWCTQHFDDDNYSVLSVSNKPESMDYLVLYRKNHEVFTVSGLVRLHQATSLSASEVFLILRKECDARGYLQLHELKTWCTGRYPIEIRLDKMLVGHT